MANNDRHERENRGGSRVGLRLQIALALMGVLVLAATLALTALRPLSVAAGRTRRARVGSALARSVAGQVALLPVNADVTALISDAVGPGALAGITLFDTHGVVKAIAGIATPRPSGPPYFDQSKTDGDFLRLVIVLPGKGVFCATVPLEEPPEEKRLILAGLLTGGLAALIALAIVYIWLTRAIVLPVQSLTRAAERVAAGRRDALAEATGAPEIVRAVHAVNTMTIELASREKDLSARVEELERATKELRLAQDQLVRSEKLAVVGRLSAGIAHEVGNPLAAIVGLTDVMQEGGLTESEVKDFAQRVGREAQRIHRTIRQLLDYARIHTNTNECADVREAVDHVLQLVRPQKDLRTVTIEQRLGDGKILVKLDSDRLVQILLNLVLNAADAMTELDVAPSETSEKKIEIIAHTTDESVVIEVQDRGKGIPVALRERVFEPFFTTKSAGHGTGLGLAICAVIAEQANGKIWVEDRPDGLSGARICLTLPIGH